MKSKLINKGYVTRKLGSSLVVFDGESSTLHTLNTTGALIFRSFKKGLKKKDIVEIFTKKYSISKEEAERDINEFITELKKKKLK